MLYFDVIIFCMLKFSDVLSLFIVFIDIQHYMGSRWSYYLYIVVRIILSSFKFVNYLWIILISYWKLLPLGFFFVFLTLWKKFDDIFYKFIISLFSIFILWVKTMITCLKIAHLIPSLIRVWSVIFICELLHPWYLDIDG